jgi:hypothetical protein
MGETGAHQQTATPSFLGIEMMIRACSIGLDMMRSMQFV